jgi:hypothetical protein
MTDRRQILYFNHDNPKPAGGVRTIYEHVGHLVRNGFNAFVVQGRTGFKPDWFSAGVPAISYEQGLNVSPDDVMVIPEDLPILWRLCELPLKKIIFCQNHFCAFSMLAPGQTWRSLGIAQVLCSSEAIAEFVRKDLGWSEAPIVHYAVDPRLFKPGKKKIQIAYMPRKAPIDAAFIRGLFTRMGGRAAEVPWMEVDGVSIERAAAIMAESAIFLSLSRLEGFGLPPIEAMASGCVVVGYHGQGGLEYARPDNGFWCPEADPYACVAALRNVVEMFLNEDAKLGPVIDAAKQTAAPYTPQRQETEIVQFMQRVLSER